MLQKQRQYDISSPTYRGRYTGTLHLTPSPHWQGRTRGRTEPWVLGRRRDGCSSRCLLPLVEGALGRRDKKLLVRPCRIRHCMGVGRDVQITAGIPKAAAAAAPQGSGSSRVPSVDCRLCALCFQNRRRLVQRRVLDCSCWKFLIMNRSVCTLASQRCYPAPFRLDAPLPMGSTTLIRDVLGPWIAPSSVVRWPTQAQSHPEFRLGKTWPKDRG